MTPPTGDSSRTSPGAHTGPLACPGCGLLSAASSRYCTGCGTPLLTEDQGHLHPWRVYGVETGIFGRHADLQVVLESLERATSERAAQLLVLHGAEGMGKTRLIGHLHEHLAARMDDAILVSGASRLGGDVPYAAINRLIRGRFYIPEQATPDTARRKLLDGVRATLRNPLADEIAHMIGYLVGLPYPESPVYGRYDHAPGRIMERARGALVQLLERDAERQPLVLVFEDLQHAGDETLELVRALHQQLGASPVLFIITISPGAEVRAPWLIAPGPRQRLHTLRRLGDEDVRALVDDILRLAGEVPEELHALICARALGSPMTVESLVRVLIDQGVIDTRGNAWSIDMERLNEVALPTTFEGLIRARQSGLTHDERLVLEKAALVGQTFWAEAIHALGRLHRHTVPDDGSLWPGQADEERTLAILQVLHRKDLIQRREEDSALPGMTEYAFKHAIERQTIYESIDPELRKRHHLLMAQWLDQTSWRLGLRPRFLEAIATHCEQGGLLARAAEVLIEAGRMASEHYRNQTAIHAFERALAFLGERDLRLHIEVLHDLGTVLDRVGEPERALDFYEEMLQAAWIVGIRPKVAVAFNKLGRAHRTLGNFDRALNDLQRGLALFEEAHDEPGVAASLTDVGQVHTQRGAYPQAEECYLRALELRRKLQEPRAQALTLNRLGAVRLRVGDFKDALRLFRQSLALRRQAQDRRGVAESLNNLAVLCQERGELEQALALYREAEATATELGDRSLLGVARHNIGEVLLETGQLDEAREALERTLELTAETGERRIRFATLCTLARLHQQREALAQALELIERAEQIAHQLDAPVLLAVALRHRGELHAAEHAAAPSTQTLVRGDEAFRQSLKLLADIGDESELGRCLSAYGEFLIQQGLLIQGRKRLEMAREIFERLEMKRTLEETESIIDGLG